MIYLDTETCGFHGPAILIQYAEDNGPIQTHDVWKNTIKDTLDLIRQICEHPGGVCGFNLAFDWFHLCQLATTLMLMPDKYDFPEDCIEQYALLESEARFGPCLKPQSACDIMLHARKGKYQTTMNRDDIKIRRVPLVLAKLLAGELDKRVKLNDIYFARKSDKTVRWQVAEIVDEEGNVDADFADVVLRFAPTSALKALAVDALDLDPREVARFSDVELPEKMRPVEYGYAPFATCIGKPGNWKWTWPDVISTHINHWAYNQLARKYAENDVKYTRDLYAFFGRPAPGDNDSILACMVGAVRWRGFSINVEGIKKLKAEAEATAASDIDFASPRVCRTYLEQVLTQTEALAMVRNGKFTTKSVVLQDIAKWTVSAVCPTCRGQETKCTVCNGTGLIASKNPHPAAARAMQILDYRHATKEIELYDKLLLAGRLHASFNIIGTRSSRMSGTDKLNPQGIKRAPQVRGQFPLADPGYTLCAGDFDSFEINIMDQVFHDPKLHQELLSGKKIHALWGECFFPGLSYEQILESKEAKTTWENYYSRAKQGVFAICYFGEAHTLQNRVGIDKDAAEQAYKRLLERYPDFAKRRLDIVSKFCSMRQPKGIGTKVEWAEPAEYVESIFGFRRYFTLENKICRALFDLATNVPKPWETLNIKVQRRDRVQLAAGAARSALYAAAFAIQSGNMRAAGNHIIQSTGAEIAKALQCAIWKHQPAGIAEWIVIPMNIHDEIQTPTKIGSEEAVSKTVNDFIAENRKHVELLAMDWKEGLKSWADK